MNQLIDASVSGIPLILVVMGLVTLSERFGAHGKVQLGVSMAIGLLLGLMYMATQVTFDSYANVFAALVFGLALGLLASGIYETGVKIVSKASALQQVNQH